MKRDKIAAEEWRGPRSVCAGWEPQEAGSDVNGTAVCSRASLSIMFVNHAVAHRFSAGSFTHRVAA